MTHPSPTALEERKLGYWYVEDADGAIARIQSGIASTRLYEYGGELPYIFGGLGRSYAQGIADAHNKRIAALEAERDELRQDHAAIFNALFGEDGKYSGTVVPKLWRYVKNAVETIGDLDEAKKKAEAQLATRLPDRQALANVLRGLKFSKYTARTIILDDGRTGYQLMADTANYVAGEIHSALLSGAATAKQPVLPERLVDAADTYFDTYSPKSCISRESVRGGMWLCPVCNHGWHDEDENDHADDCPVKIIRELRERRAATPAPTAALTEDAPTTTDEGPKPKYGEFYAADLPEEQQYRKAVQVVIKEQKASTSFIQRHLQIGYNRAARLLERMVVEGICTEPNGVGKRTVLQPEVKPGQIDVMEF